MTQHVTRSLQHDTLCRYVALQGFEQDWPGTLLLCAGLDRALALAALASGAATLILESDESALRQARQDVTFTVTTLDEAVRALKNEIRQRRAITVALLGPSERWLHEVAERGILPDAIWAAETFVSLTNYMWPNVRRVPSAATLAVGEDAAESLKDRRTRDAELCARLPQQRRWLEAAATLFPRDLTRLYLHDERFQPLP